MLYRVRSDEATFFFTRWPCSVNMDNRLNKARIMGMPASRMTDMHVCPMVTGIIPHVGGPIISPCVPTVLIGSLPASHVGDMCICVGPPDTIVKGSGTVITQSTPAVRIGDMTAHGGNIVLGFPTVLIGG